MSDNQKAVDSLEKENLINKDKIQSLQTISGIHTEQMKSITNDLSLLTTKLLQEIENLKTRVLALETP
tara:strand:- start:1149 stop:1352 length:204 start_codon:yes stop_codon:yes gene_type:complete